MPTTWISLSRNAVVGFGAAICAFIAAIFCARYCSILTCTDGAIRGPVFLVDTRGGSYFLNGSRPPELERVAGFASTLSCAFTSAALNAMAPAHRNMTNTL